MMVALLHNIAQTSSASGLRHSFLSRPRSLIRHLDLSSRYYWRTKNRSRREDENKIDGVQVRHRKRTISFLTDVEGDQEYLTRFVNQSKLLTFASCNNTRDSYEFPFPYDHHIDFVDKPSENEDPAFEPILVYGGDVWDQGGSDLYVIRQLLSFKARYPRQVLFLYGNRDINKIRILQELGLPSEEVDSSTAKKKKCSPHGGVYWLRGTGLVGDPLLLRKEEVRNDASRSSLTKDPVDRLKWMLAKTMGSPRAFQYRKEELQREREANSDDRTVDDEDVVASYLETCHPAGEMGLYLSQANLAVQMGPVLFLHGALPLTPSLLRETLKKQREEISPTHSSVWDDYTKFMPWLPPETSAGDVGVATNEDWIVHLNQFAKRSISAWRNDFGHNNNCTQKGRQQEPWCLKGGYHNNSAACGWGAFLQYGMGWTADKKQNPTIVYNRWSSNGMPFRFFPSSLQSFTTEGDANDEENEIYRRSVKEFFQHSPQLSLICTGHQPQGDLATAICIEIDSKGGGKDDQEKKLAWIIPSDTSYSGDVRFWDAEQQSAQIQVGREESKSGRGMRAVCEVLISWDETEPPSDTNPLVRFHGTLSNGKEYETLPLPMTTTAQTNSHHKVGNLDDAAVGPAPKDSPHEGPWWSRAAFRDGSLLLSSGHEFHFWNCLVKNPKDAKPA